MWSQDLRWQGWVGKGSCMIGGWSDVIGIKQDKIIRLLGGSVITYWNIHVYAILLLSFSWITMFIEQHEQMCWLFISCDNLQFSKPGKHFMSNSLFMYSYCWIFIIAPPVFSATMREYYLPSKKVLEPITLWKLIWQWHENLLLRAWLTKWKNFPY